MSVVKDELEVSPNDRRIGSGWISGTIALALALAGLGAVLCFRYPQLLTVADARKAYNVPLLRLLLHVDLIAAFVLGVVSIVLRKQKVLGFSALSLALAATLLGGSRTEARFDFESELYLGLDWFLLNLIFTGIIFIPIERLLKRVDQPIFRHEWREDLFYLLVSSLLVQSLTYLSMIPSNTILATFDLGGIRSSVASQPIVLQFLEIMFLTDFVQYWLHRAFHQFSFLWRFHAVHHSAESMDWLAGSRMHLMEIICLRGCTVIPMYVLGYSDPALYGYIFAVYLFSTLVHANIRTELPWVNGWLVTPRFHHWHHGIEKEAIDVNFAVHFPLFDRLFGTYHLPDDGRWPSGYGVATSPVPKGFVRQHLYPFTRDRKDDSFDGATASEQ